MLVLIFLGCATAPPQPLIIKHQNAPSWGSTAVSRAQNQKEVSDGSSVSLVDSLKKKLVGLFKKKNVVSADESARFVKQSEMPAAPEKVTATPSITTSKEQNENIPAAAAVETKKDIPEFVKSQVSEEKPKETAKSDKMSADKTAPGAAAEMKKESVPSGIIVVGNSDTKRYHLPGMPNYDKVLKYHRVLFESEQQAIESGYYKAGTKKRVGTSKQAGKESRNKQNAEEKMKKDHPDQVKNDEQKDVSQKAEKNDNEQKEKIPASVSEEIKKDLREPVKNEEQKDVPQETAKIDKEEQSEKTPASVSEEMKKDIPDQVKNEEQKDVSQEAAKIDKEQIENIPAGVSEETNKNVPEPAKNDEQKDASSEAVKSNKEQNEKIPEGVSDEPKEDSPEAVKNDEQKESPPAVTTRIDDAQVDEIMDGVKEKLKSDIHEQVYNQVKEMLPKEITDELKKTDLTPFLPDWMKRIRLSADARLRYEYFGYDKQNYNEFTILSQGTDTGVLQNTWASTDDFKYRIRLGVESINPYFDAVIRLSTGNTTTPISTNTVFGDYLNKDAVVFDLAYVKLKPWDFLSIYGGRMPNLWFSTDLLWARDLNFEGFSIAARKTIGQSLSPFLTIGAFPLQQSGPTSTLDFSQHSKWLYAAQTGMEIENNKGISTKVGAAYYLFSNITGELNETLIPGATDWSSPMYNQRGNTIFYIDPLNSKKFGLASEFKEVNITGVLDIGFWDPVHVILTGDYVRNIGFNLADVAARTGLAEPEQWINGYKIGLSVGYPKIQEFGQWKASLDYKYVGRDAVVDAFTDSDFNMGTNAKGWILGAELGLTKNMWIVTRWISTNEISGPPLAIDLFQLDLNVKF